MPQKENAASLRSATGMMEWWNVGIMDFGRLEYLGGNLLLSMIFRNSPALYTLR
jgi:hypothetical protein